MEPSTLPRWGGRGLEGKFGSGNIWLPSLAGATSSISIPIPGGEFWLARPVHSTQQGTAAGFDIIGSTLTFNAYGTMLQIRGIISTGSQDLPGAKTSNLSISEILPQGLPIVLS